MTGTDYAMVGALLAAFVGVPGVYTIAMLKGIRADTVLFRQEIREDMQLIEARVQVVESAKVGTKDWVRVEVSQQSRMNRMSEQLARIDAKIDASIGIAAGSKQTDHTMKNQRAEPTR